MPGFALIRRTACSARVLRRPERGRAAAAVARVVGPVTTGYDVVPFAGGQVVVAGVTLHRVVVLVALDGVPAAVPDQAVRVGPALDEVVAVVGGLCEPRVTEDLIRALGSVDLVVA